MPQMTLPPPGDPGTFFTTEIGHIAPSIGLRACTAAPAEIILPDENAVISQAASTQEPVGWN